MTKETIVLAAGGTGGHIFPAQALAENLLASGKRVVLVTDKRFLKYTDGFTGAGAEVRIIRSGGMSGGLIKRAMNAVHLLVGIFQARSIIKELKPVAVIGFGGYPSFPTVLAGTQLGCYTLIHEQNSVLGRANRMLAGRVSAIATSFASTSHVPDNAKAKVVFTGNPVRLAVQSLHNVPYPELGEDAKMHVLVMGGSLGATVFSRVVPEALRLLPPELRARLRIDQQCRAADIEEVRTKYQEMAVNADLATFFNDVPARLAAAHLVIGRAGASTVAELLTSGRPAILVPYPHAMDDHQRYNANTIEDAGAGWLMLEEGFTPEALSGKLESFLQLPTVLSEAAAKARRAAHPDAANKLAALVLKQIV